MLQAYTLSSLVGRLSCEYISRTGRKNQAGTAAGTEEINRPLRYCYVAAQAS